MQHVLIEHVRDLKRGKKGQLIRDKEAKGPAWSFEKIDDQTIIVFRCPNCGCGFPLTDHAIEPDGCVKTRVIHSCMSFLRDAKGKPIPMPTTKDSKGRPISSIGYSQYVQLKEYDELIGKRKVRHAMAV